MPLCSWADSSPAMRRYHDREWGVPLHHERRLFELLILEGAQAGLSWATILHKRAAYQRDFLRLNPHRIVRMTARDQAALLKAPRDPSIVTIVRNRAKVAATVTNARAFLALQKEFGSFSDYLWQFTSPAALAAGGRFAPTPGGSVGGPIINRPRTARDVPARTALSDALSRDLKRRGFTFVGSTICYAFMQAAGLVNDHLRTCPSAPGRRPTARSARTSSARR